MDVTISVFFLCFLVFVDAKAIPHVCVHLKRQACVATDCPDQEKTRLPDSLAA